MLDYKKFSTIFSALCEFFDKEPSKVFIQMYYKLLQDLTDEQMESAITEVLKIRKYTKMPLPAEIREYVFGNIESRAILAIDQVSAAIEKVGSYSTIVFPDNVINHVVSGFPGGWPKLCETTYEEWQFVRKDLIRRYIALDTRRNDLQQIKALPGRTEAENSIRGLSHESQAVKVIDKIIIGILPGKKLKELPS